MLTCIVYLWYIPRPNKQLTNTTEPLEEDRSNVLREINAARLRLDEEKDGVTRTEDAADEESHEIWAKDSLF